MLTPAGMTPIEAAAGLVLDAPTGRRRPAEPSGDPLHALSDAVAEALSRPPCVVSFSGGRDSSLLLAACVAVGRARGLEPPIPATLRYPDEPESHESPWQERVIAHLGVRDWVRIELATELDCVGSLAQEQMLRERAPLYPANAHSVVPVAELAEGGTVILGIGGDEILAPQRWQPLGDLFARRRAPESRDVMRLAFATLPRGLRGRVLATREGYAGQLHWLRPAAQRELSRMLARVADEPVRFDRATVAAASLEYLRLGTETIRRIARSRGAELATPLLDPRFVAACATAGGRSGWPSRTAAMRSIAAGLLPDEVLARGSKARFSGAFFTCTTRAFAARWSGAGVDPELVVPEALRSMWLEPQPDFRTGVLLQSAWLHDSLRAVSPREPAAVAA